MTMKRLHFVVLLCTIGFYQVGPAQEATNAPARVEETAAKPELTPELKLARNALLDKGSSEQMRVDAVGALLASEEPQGREILLDALLQTENGPARVAVCQVLSQARTNRQSISEKGQFIGPLLGVLSDENDSTAKLAAEATLMFDYDQIAEPLDKLLLDTSAPLGGRLNAVYVLQLRPDMRAAVKLLELVDNPESLVGAAARVALNVLGLEVGSDAAARAGIISMLREQGQEAYLRERLIRQRSEIQRKTAESMLWQDRYLSAQGKICDSIVDEGEKGKFVAGHLGASETTRKLWALKRLWLLRLDGKTTPKLTTEVGAALVSLISDSDRTVRLKTSELLSLMGQVNSVERLLAQLEVEKDDQVRTAVFSALGGACYYASLDTSPFKISAELRQKTLQWAEKYLSHSDAGKSQKGAAVIGRLLEQDGLTEEQSKTYLGVLSERYGREKGEADSTLRGELLGVMAGLCAQGAHSVESRTLFGPLFEEGLTDKADRVREKAVDGLIYINKAAAMERLRKAFYDDPSSRIRKKLIGLAAEVGGKADLPLLAEKIGSNGESELAWRAMMKIFSGSDGGVLVEWVDKLFALDKDNRPASEQMIAFLELAERKITGQSDFSTLEKVRESLVGLYLETSQIEKAARYQERLRDSAKPGRKEEFTEGLLEIYLRRVKPDLASKLMGEALETSDLDPNSALVQALDSYMSQPPAGSDPNGLYDALASLKVSQERPKWQQWLKTWAVRLAGAKATEKPSESPKPQEG